MKQPIRRRGFVKEKNMINSNANINKFTLIQKIWFFIGLGYSLLFGVAVAFFLYIIANKPISSSVYTWIATFISLSFFTIFWKFIFLPYLYRSSN